MRILITGGSGFLGARTIPALVAAGHEVFALARSASSTEKVRALGATPISGDLEQPKTLSLPALDAIVHAAAHLRFAGPRAPYFRANVAGTLALLTAAEKVGVNTFIYADERAPTFPNSFSGYIASKSRAEAAVIAANKPGFRTIALRPPAIWGPGDRVSAEIPHAIEAGRFAFIDRGDLPFPTCHVDNVIEAVGRALERGSGGRAYFINDQETTTFREFVSSLAALKGLTLEGVRSVPYGVAKLIASVMEFAAAVTRSHDDPPLTRTMVRMTGRAFTTNDAAARRDLGYIGVVTREEGLRLYNAKA